VRDARAADRDSIGRLWSELMEYHRSIDSRFTIAPDAERKYVRHAHEMMRSTDGRVLVAEESAGSRIVGYMLGEMQNRPPMALPGRYGFISDVFVVDDWRHRGVGAALYADMRRWFVLRKALAVELYVAESNPAAQEFWRNAGLVPFLKLLHEDLDPK